MLKNIRKKTEGFTIIEVMIVLAIAGLILLIVFLAVPALERTARNTSRKNDASAIAAAISNYDSNNGGTLPNNAIADADPTSADIGCAAAPVTGCTVNGNFETAKLGIYKPASINFALAAPSIKAPGTACGTAVIDTTCVVVVYGYQCNPSNTGLGTVNANTESIMYVLEAASGNGTIQCLEE